LNFVFDFALVCPGATLWNGWKKKIKNHTFVEIFCLKIIKLSFFTVDLVNTQVNANLKKTFFMKTI
jgi:hypothetical protein